MYMAYLHRGIGVEMIEFVAPFIADDGDGCRVSISRHEDKPTNEPSSVLNMTDQSMAPRRCLYTGGVLATVK